MESDVLETGVLQVNFFLLSLGCGSRGRREWSGYGGGYEHELRVRHSRICLCDLAGLLSFSRCTSFPL